MEDNMKNKKRMYLHGECIIKEIEKLPESIEKREDEKSIIIAESETIGNEHRIRIKEVVYFFWTTSFVY